MIRFIGWFAVFVFTGLNGVSQDKFRSIDLGNSIQLRLTETDFNKDESQIVYNDDSLVVMIDREMVFGTDGLLPRTYLKNAELMIDQHVIPLDTKGMFDPYLNVIDRGEIQFMKNYSGYKLRMVLSLGAGSYGVEWTIIDKQSFVTLISNDIELLDQYFIKQE